MKKNKKLKPNLPSGFKDTNTKELVLRDSLIEIIKRNFQLYGFEQIDTSSFEFLENVVDYNNENEGFPINDIFYFQSGTNSLVNKNEISTIALRPRFNKITRKISRKKLY